MTQTLRQRFDSIINGPDEPEPIGFEDFAVCKGGKMSYHSRPPWKIELHHDGEEPLQLWHDERFYVDLPKSRYLDTVYVDWSMSLEDEETGEYIAECRVCPELGEPWELFQMKRVDG